jgi:hypothetical protein
MLTEFYICYALALPCKLKKPRSTFRIKNLKSDRMMTLLKYKLA